ncbi:hypothetical protein ABT300_37255 [Streptomyces sp. NPDC001027]|uniref:hypothetical protein n=1 Tax=Streptomyces sp. NPDC001027 TaxID=3154771 RepID=UPI00331C8683
MTCNAALREGPLLPARVTRVASRTALYSIFAAWGTLTVLRNLNQSQELLYKFGRFGLTIPNYRFFGPTPAMHDLALLIRHRHRDGSLTEWNQMVVSEERSPTHTFWAPFRRAEKAVADAIRELYRTGGDVVSAGVLPKTMGYRLLLHVARNQAPHGNTAADVQFAVCQIAAHEPQIAPQITFVSEMHDLATGDIAAEHVPHPAAATEERS